MFYFRINLFSSCYLKDDEINKVIYKVLKLFHSRVLKTIEFEKRGGVL